MTEQLYKCERHGTVDTSSFPEYMIFPYFAGSPEYFCPVCFLEMLDLNCKVLKKVKDDE